MLLNILTAAELALAGIAGDRDMTRRPGGAVGNEDFSSILAHFAGVGERPVRGQIGEYAEHGQSVLDSQRAIQESTELGQGDWGKPLAYLSGVTEGSPYGGIPSGTTEDDQRQLNEVRRPNEERESLQGRPEGVPMGESLQIKWRPEMKRVETRRSWLFGYGLPRQTPYPWLFFAGVGRRKKS